MLSADAATPALPVSEGQAGAAGKKSRGRPKGAQNLITRDLERLVTAKLNRPAIMEMVRLYQLPLDKLGEHFGKHLKTDAGDIRLRILEKIADKMTPALAQLKVDKTERVIVQFGDMGEQATLDLLDGDLIDVTINETNDLGESEG